MTIERTDTEVIIRLPSYIDTEGLQNMIDLLINKEVNTNSQVNQDDIDNLVKEIKSGWWQKNRDKYIK